MPFHVNLSSLFTPGSVAVIGASRREDKIGGIILNNLLEMQFPGTIYPVNPQGGSIRGLPVLRKLSDLPAHARPLDLAVVCLPAEKTLDCLRELETIPAKAAILIASGFRETGGAGAALEKDVKKLAKSMHMALLGPNCLGVINTSARLNASFSQGSPKAGNLGFFSQSGALCNAIFDWAREQGFGFSSFISTGNKAVLDEADFLAFLAEDPQTKVILGYLESVENGPRFLHSAHIATRKKPVILLKAGSTPSGAKVAAAHTGALAGTDLAYEAAFRQTGIIRARRTEELFDLAQAFAEQPLPMGPGVGILTNAGGPGIIAADACETLGLTLAGFSQTTLKTLENLLPPHAPRGNPVDIQADAPLDRLAQCLSILLADPSVHSLLVLGTPTPWTALTDFARVIAEAEKPDNKPIFVCLMGGGLALDARKLLQDAGIPGYWFPESAMHAIWAMYRQSRWKETPLPVEIGYRHDPGRARDVLEKARADGNMELTAAQTRALLAAYEMPILEMRLARTSGEAEAMAVELGLPVALKIDSPAIPHKTDIQGVALNLDTPAKVRAAFEELTARAQRLRKNAYISGCRVQAMAPKDAREAILGFRRDPTFGPMVLFGLSGIHAQAFKDIACRLAPLSLDDAHDMVREIKAFPILAGMRGEPAVKFTAAEDLLLIVSQLALDFPDIQEVECGPVFLSEQGAFVAGARVLLAPSNPIAGHTALGAHAGHASKPRENDES